jgi:hypothetical protein
MLFSKGYNKSQLGTSRNTDLLEFFSKGPVGEKLVFEIN